MSEKDLKLNSPEFMTAISNMDSISVVEQVLSETVLQKVAEHAYNKSLPRKVRPFCALSTVATMAS